MAIKLSFLVMMFMCFISVTSVNAASSEVKVLLDGRYLQLDVPPQVINNRVMMPMRAVFEALNASVKWDDATLTITALSENGDVVKLSIGNEYIYKNNKKVTIDSPPVSVNGRTLVPVRVIAESLGRAVTYRSDSRTVIIEPVDASQEESLIADISIDTSIDTSINASTNISVKTTTPVPTQEVAYEKMIALKEQYPEGMAWTNNNVYAWNGGIYSRGYGCVGFAFILSDAAFGNLPARKHTDFNNIQVGDIVRINNDTHSVIILSIDDTNVTIAEGNFNSSIHWGRMFTLEHLQAVGDFIITRYPE